MLFLNTRPADRAAGLTQALQAAQVEVLELPLLELAPTPWSEALAQLYAQLDTVQAIVAVSPSAVHYGMAGLQRSGLPLHALAQVQWIAVGEATAQALQSYGVSSHVPEVETSEGMLDLPALHRLSASAGVAFWRGEGGRQFMMDSLRAKGMRILNFVLYRRQCPAQAAQILAANLARLQREPRYCMLISSEASWLNWLALTADHPELLNHAHILALGGRLSGLLDGYRQARQLTFSSIQLNDLRLESILQQIAPVQGTP